ncbi:PREDICTED: neural proliferation differentiation and control protein 1 [Tinamus guttatus]|uniref:neural proliferation differentiation and control protein 1 n=1 Tax=Tinamus guttatus TaxID=94827 RepID=UPI00052F3E3D|nr:PREDICTED: neural proliferation differentiation and control protein 1 [Tinamus guttatus]
MQFGGNLDDCGLVDTDYSNYAIVLGHRVYNGQKILVLLLYTPSCPRSLDCTLRRRELCTPGAGACGPCLQPFVEDERGQCVPKKHAPSAASERVRGTRESLATHRLCLPGEVLLAMNQATDAMRVSRALLPECLCALVAAGLGVTAAPAPQPWRQSPGRTSLPGLEEEIDFLADVLARQDAARPPPLRDGKARAASAPVGKHRVASRLRGVEFLQRDPAGTKAATTLPASTTETVQKYPVEASPIPSNDAVVLGLIVVCTVAGISALLVAAVCWCRLQKEVRLAQKADYSAQRVPSPLPYDNISPGDKTLAQSAQMYHYQHQKQQMLSMEKHKEEPKLPDSASSDEENEDGDFTVYECPGLAPTGEMEVRNPLFDDSTLHPPNLKSHQ